MPLSGLTGAPIILPEGTAPPAYSGPTFNESIEEARSRVPDFSPTSRASYVKEMLSKALEYKGMGDSIEVIKQRLPLFIRDYPHLFEMIMDPNHDKQILATMIAMLDRMGDGSLTQHQASMIVGRRLFDKLKK
jgi:hypothetical protein